jgi:plastocyanin
MRTVRLGSLALAALLLAPAALAGGGIKGRVGYTGRAPAKKALDRKSDKFCAAIPAFDESLLLSPDGKAVANVLVRVKGAPATPPPSVPVVVDQVACVYRPRVQGAVEGQRVEIRNTDPTFHNVHAYQDQRTLFNTGQPAKVRPANKALPAGDGPMKLKCDVHPWMIAYVFPHPNGLFAVTDSEGRFSIEGIPPGKYTLEVWHETLGTQSIPVTIEEGKTIEPKISFAGAK